MISERRRKHIISELLRVQAGQQTALSSAHRHQYLGKVSGKVASDVFGGLGVVAVEEVAAVAIRAVSFLKEGEARLGLV